MTQLDTPLNSLKSGHWFKLICGASFQHLPAIRSLALAYTLAGADCIDVAADLAVISTVKEALALAERFREEAQHRGFTPSSSPWLMVSLNDGEDPHFRKAEFDSTQCPIDCPRPCEPICPARAITFQDTGGLISGVIEDKCYGCGRCLSICPEDLIFSRSYVSSPETLVRRVLATGIDAIEIHTQMGHFEQFQALWNLLNPALKTLKLLAISCPDTNPQGDQVIEYLYSLDRLISPLPCLKLWQTDGRPMSGDLGKGTTGPAVRLAAKILQAKLPGYIQLAGGTNQHTVLKLQQEGLLKKEVKNPSGTAIAGIAFGSYARVLLSPILEELEKQGKTHLEEEPQLLWQAVSMAHSLVKGLKSA